MQGYSYVPEVSAKHKYMDENYCASFLKNEMWKFFTTFSSKLSFNTFKGEVWHFLELTKERATEFKTPKVIGIWDRSIQTFFFFFLNLHTWPQIKYN